ncbi:MAG: hypothetical protein RBT19_09840 [Tenuifilaceae bacterium]|jgi:hypothetical protein|nr:hypothetical protein [Tenuifilaceae bacterium]
MKRLIYALAVFALVASSCGGESPKKESTQEVKKDKPLSKRTQEGMMQLLNSCDISLHDALVFEEVLMESNAYKIRFISSDIDEESLASLEGWFAEQVENLVNNGWKKRVIRDNEMMFGARYTEIVLLKPEGMKVNVSYGLSFYSQYNDSKKEYRFTVSAD